METSVHTSSSGYRPDTAPQRLLSKSDFKLARTCEAKLYFRENRYPDNRQFDPYLRLLQRGGYMAEALAKAKYPDAVQLAYGRNVHDDFARTMEELHKENVTLFEATLLVGRRLARVDILEKRGNVVRLIEVKSSTFEGDQHAAQVADGKPGIFRGVRKPHPILEKWRDYFEDLTFQVLLLEKVLPGATVEPWLALLDKSKEALIDDIPSLFELVMTDDRLHTARYIGTREQYASLDLVTEVSVGAEVHMLREEIEDAAAALEARLDDPLDVFLTGLERGTKCGSCEFRHDSPTELDGFSDCWGDLAKPRPHALELFSVGLVKAEDGRPIVDALFDAGTTSLYDIPIERLAKANGEIGPLALRQRRQIEYTRRNEIFLDAALGKRIASLADGRPMQFIDFEAARLALPYHTKMRPYGLLAFQWSCHTIAAAGETPVHTAWLNTEDLWPNHTFAETLRASIGDEGHVLTWSSFEKSTLRQISSELSAFGREAPDLVEWMRDVAERRVVDMYKWCNDWYYNPGMKGRSSIKVVLDAIWRSDALVRSRFEELTGLAADAERDPYASLPPIEINGVLQNVQEGTGAVLAYEEMMYGVSKRDPVRRAGWSALLGQYCALDTLSMVLVFEHWRRIALGER